MATLQQLAKNRRKTKKKKVRRISLESCPQKRGTVLRAFKMTPRKPNSALRHVIRVILSNKRLISAYVPGMYPDKGQRQDVVAHHNVLIRGGRVKDLPGMKYKVIRAKKDVPPTFGRKTARSKYGIIKMDARDKEKRRKPFKRTLLW
jgi:small subunit ribosomal protein S12